MISSYEYSKMLLSVPSFLSEQKVKIAASPSNTADEVVTRILLYLYIRYHMVIVGLVVRVICLKYLNAVVKKHLKALLTIKGVTQKYVQGRY